MKTKFLALAPGVVLGLYIGRLLSELWATFNGTTSLLVALAITLIVTAVCAYLFQHIPFKKSWPALLLLFYVFYPELSFPMTLATTLFALLVAWQVSRIDKKSSSGHSYILGGALLLALGFLVLYGLTLAPDILPADNGEFQVVATNLGVAHPPGFSLYTIIAHLMTRLPFGPTPAYRVNFLSAITSALTLAAVYTTLFILTKRHLASIIAAVALGSAVTFWAQATTANIRSLSGLFAALMFLLLVAFYDAVRNSHGQKNGRLADRYLILFALTLGLGITHHASLAFMAIIGAIFVLLVDPSFIRTPRRWWKPLVTLILGLLPLLYFPLRAASGARGTSPDLASMSGFLEHVLALGFRGDLFTYLEPALLWERFKIMGNVLTFQFEPILLLGMVLGFLILLWRDWRLAFLIGGSFALHTFITATYRAPQTVEYMLPAYIPLAILLGVAVGDPSGPWKKIKFKGVYIPLREILAASMLIAAFQQMIQNYPSYKWLHQDTTARDYAQTILADAPPDSVILADWHWVTPFWYLQEVEGQRPDITVRFVYPDGESYSETWVRRIRDELDRGYPVMSTHFDPGAFSALPSPEPVHEAFLYRQEPRTDIPKSFTQLNVQVGNQILLTGYQVAGDDVHAGGEIILDLAWKPIGDMEAPLAIFAHLSGADGRVFAQQDIPVSTLIEGIGITQFRLTPRLETVPGEYTLLVGAYDSDPLPDDSGNKRTPLTNVSVDARTYPQITSNSMRRMISSEDRQLVGFDWDNSIPDVRRLYLHWRTAEGYQTEVRDNLPADLPSYLGPWGVLSYRWNRITKSDSGNYVPFGHGIVWVGNQLDGEQTLNPGQSITLSQNFLSSQPIMRDYSVSVRLIGYEEDGYHWAWWDLDDGIPAMGAIPTLKWIEGSHVRSPHFITVNADAPSGQIIGGALNLYDAFTGRLLPILDERINAEFAWVPLGEAKIK